MSVMKSNVKWAFDGRRTNYRHDAAYCRLYDGFFIRHDRHVSSPTASSFLAEISPCYTTPELSIDARHYLAAYWLLRFGR